MAYANRLSLSAPGPGPLAGGRWHKPARLPGSLRAPASRCHNLPGGLGLPPLRAWATLAPYGLGLGGLTGSGPLGPLPWPWRLGLGSGAASLPGSLTGSQRGGLAGRLGGLSMY